MQKIIHSALIFSQLWVEKKNIRIAFVLKSSFSIFLLSFFPNDFFFQNVQTKTRVEKKMWKTPPDNRRSQNVDDDIFLPQYRNSWIVFLIWFVCSMLIFMFVFLFYETKHFLHHRFRFFYYFALSLCSGRFRQKAELGSVKEKKNIG